jgi:signal transduction histidine kinase
MGNDIAIRKYSHAHIMLEHMPVRVALYDAHDLCLLDANPQYLQEMERFLEPELQGGSIIGHCLTEWEGMTEGVGASFIALLRQVATTGVSYHGERKAFSVSEEETTYWDFSIDPIREDGEQIPYLLVTASEVTRQVLAQREAEQQQAALSEANQELQAEYKWSEIVETIARSIRQSLDISFVGEVAADAIATHFSTLGVCLHMADTTTRSLHLLSLYTSRNYRELSDALRYMPYERLAFTRTLPYEDVPVIISDLQKDGALAALRQQGLPLDENTRGFVGVPLWFNDQFEGTLTAFFDYTIEANGPEVQALKASSTHIASALSQARLHAAVDHERAYLHTLLEQLPEGVMIINAITGSIIYANPAATQLLGTPHAKLKDTLVHRHPAARYPYPSRFYGHPITPWNFAVVRALAGEQLNCEETLIMQSEEHAVIALMSSAQLRTHSVQGIIQEIAIVFQDITIQKSLEQHKNEFFSVINHELRTPLTIIQGYAEMLQLHVLQEKVSDPFLNTAATNIMEQSEQLNHLIEDMLNISRIEHAQFTMQYARHDLLATVMRVVESQIVTSKRPIELVFEGLELGDTLMAIFDEERIVQVLHNLINNAIKYSASDSKIWVEVHYTLQRSQSVLIQVKDQGMGIAESELPHIFKRFHRAPMLNPAIGGFGIGLYLAKEIVTHHGGHIWAESREGCGSTFSFELPLNGQLS